MKNIFWWTFWKIIINVHIPFGFFLYYKHKFIIVIFFLKYLFLDLFWFIFPLTVKKYQKKTMVLEKMSLPTEIIFVYCYKFILLFNFFKFFFNDSSILINIISCDYLNLSLANEYVGDVTIPTQVIKYNQNFLQVDQPIRLQYSNQIILLFVLFLCLVKIVYYCL
jgi:hypothetical protein